MDDMEKANHIDLVELRKNLKDLDEKIVELLAARFLYAKKVGAFKRKHKLPIKDNIQENLVKKRYLLLAKDFEVHSDFASQLAELIIIFSKKTQE